MKTISRQTKSQTFSQEVKHESTAEPRYIEHYCHEFRAVLKPV